MSNIGRGLLQSGKKPAEKRSTSDKPKKFWSFDNPSTSLFEFFEKMVSIWDDDTEVTQENLLSIDAWWRGVRVISDSISGLPVKVYRKDDSGKITEHPDHIVHRLMNIEASPVQSHFTWKSGRIDETLNTGDSFSFIQRDRAGFPKYLIPIYPGAISQWRVDRKYNLYWKVNGQEQWMSDKDIFHTMGFSDNGVTGLNPVEVHRMSLSASRGATNYADKLMKNGAFLSGVLETENPVSEKRHEMLNNSWREAFGGAKNAGKVPILDMGMSYKPISLSPVDAEWLGMRKDLVAVVSRILGVPMHMLSELDNATYSNIEHQAQEFERYSLRPWIERMEAEIRRKLFTKDEIEDGYYVSFDTSALLRGNLVDQAAYYERMWQNGFMNQDEVRADINKGPVEGGDRFFVMGNNMVPTDRVDEIIDSNVRDKSLSGEMRKKSGVRRRESGEENEEEDGRPKPGVGRRK